MKVDKIFEFEAGIKRDKEFYKKQSNLFVKIRLGIFALFLVFFVLGALKESGLYFGLGALFLVGFIVSVSEHLKIQRAENFLNKKLEIIEEYKQKVNGEWKNNVGDTGLDFASEYDNYVNDLDIVGEQSLFKLLSVCKTKGARVGLMDRLTSEYEPKEQIEKNQRVVSELSNKPKFMLNFSALLKQYESDAESNNDLEVSKKILEKRYSKSYGFLLLAVALLVGFVVTLILYAVDVLPSFVCLIMLFLELCLNYGYSFKHNKMLNEVGVFTSNVSSLYNLYDLIAKEDFETGELKQTKKVMAEALPFMKKAIHLKTLNHLRENGIMSIILNLVFFLDIFVGYKFTVISGEKGNISESIDCFETLCVNVSLANLSLVRNTCVPKITDEIKLNAIDLKHPLLDVETAIGNDINVKNGVNIITGSNMSGKTSFMRTVGINLALFYAGAEVCAKSFSGAEMKIFTSMRIADNLSKGISTFYAELLQIKTSVEYVKKKLPMVVFIDEVFRGTNSNDRINGAIALIQKLNKSNVMLFMTTHDFELCSVTGENINNFHFSEHYEGDKIMFDYKIKKGRCETTNAKYLMQLAGIIGE